MSLAWLILFRWPGGGTLGFGCGILKKTHRTAHDKTAQCVWRPNGMRQEAAFSATAAAFTLFRASLAASVSLAGWISLLVPSNAVHLAIDESAQNNYEGRCIRLMNLP